MTEVALSNVEHGTLTLRGDEIAVQVGYVSHNDLIFFPENPRIYTIVGMASEEPTQNEIFEALKDMEHVKLLVQSIKNNGGLHEPIIVRGNLVLEGNSRLAAYRLLSEKDPVKWGRIKCKVLPGDISDDLVFALLGEYHIIGKKDWAPYEQAGYLYRRHKVIGIPTQEIARELSMTTNAVNKLINTYEFMKSASDTDLNRWSYYEEYLKIKNIRQLQEDYEQLDCVFITKVKTGEIPRAADVRDKLKVILAAKPRTINKFLSGEKDFKQSYDAAVDQGHSDGCYKTLHKFRSWIVEHETEEDLLSLSKEIRDKCIFEINRIHKRIEKLIEKLN
ncbi:ParB N-terminal domain-containing protein [Geobacter pelophilus]|uniref:ParB N-terminal domain-containing protein n=1 Tax=Geoanaerobacter pelophilus TaxID=60036 RepID=A0AAW4L0R0_9BACT|nr:ParB N-terminal domain-containing protein [Geoanaerobacter pelophilus]MBT0664503.1 ParB N-terminal domain-containing protein [Geoanaerobacter pelophilus]